MLNIFGEKPDHPMSSMEEARKLLADLPEDNPHKALVEISDWLATVKEAPGFSPGLRAEIIMLLDETGQPLQAKLLRQYLDAPHLQDFQGLHLWKGIHGFMLALSEAYARALSHFQQSDRKHWESDEKIPVICVRLMRAVAEQMKLELMRYIEVTQAVWDRLLGCYSFAEANQLAGSMVHAYPGHVIHTSPQRELLRALVLYESSPGTLAPDQIEVGYRIAGRMAGFFDLKLTPEEGCRYFVDLSMPGAPRRVGHDLHATPAMRFFGAAKAIPAIEKIISQNEHDAAGPERRFGNEFTPAGKLTVLWHLLTYWGNELPHRHGERRNLHSSLEVTHGFRVVSQVVTCIDLDNVADLSEKDTAALKERSGINLLAGGRAEEADHAAEMWEVADVSVDGIGAVLPRGTGNWVKIGDLCGVRPQHGGLWWAGMVRRLQTDANGKVHVGIELLTKKPVSVWLRALGKGAETSSNWATSSGSFEYTYLPVILLPDVRKQDTMLMESGNYVAGNVYQVMMGEKSRDIRLTGLLAEGEDYEQVSFEWLEGTQV